MQFANCVVPQGERGDYGVDLLFGRQANTVLEARSVLSANRSFLLQGLSAEAVQLEFTWIDTRDEIDENDLLTHYYLCNL